MRDWKDSEHKTSYCYIKESGKIIGQIYNLAHTNIYGAKVYNNFNEEQYLGQYIDLNSAKVAVDNFWNIQERTLPNETTS